MITRALSQYAQNLCKEAQTQITSTHVWAMNAVTLMMFPLLLQAGKIGFLIALAWAVNTAYVNLKMFRGRL